MRAMRSRLLMVVSGALLGLLSLGPAPVGALQRAPLKQRLETSRSRVLNILSKPDWYRPFLEMLRQELHHRRSPDNDPGAMPTLAVPDNLPPPPPPPPPPPSPPPPPRRSRRSPGFPRLELTAALKLDDRVCLNVTAPIIGSPPEAVFNADACDAELRISVRLTPKRSSNGTSHRRPTSPPAAAEAAGGAESSAGGGYSRLRTPCSEKNYCLFGGECTHYRILDMHMCKCRPGFGGSRCEKYDVETVLTTLDSGRRQGVIGNGPIRAETHSDVLSVVESTALLLATDDSA